MSETSQAPVITKVSAYLDMACALLRHLVAGSQGDQAREDTDARTHARRQGHQDLAKSLFKELRASGYTANQILGLSTELIDLVTRDLRAQGDARPTEEKSSEAAAF